MFILLRQRNFALLWWGGLISITGNRVLTMAIPFYIYAQTRSTVATATMMIAMILPSLLFSSLAGVFVDRWDRRQVMIVTNLLLAVILLPLLALPLTGWIWLVYLVAFAEATIATFFYPAENALLPRLVGEDQLLPANTLNTLNNTIASLIGWALGGILLGRWGIELVILFDSLSYLLAALFVFLVDATPEQTRVRGAEVVVEPFTWQNFRREWQEGLALIFQHHIIALLFIISSLSLLGGTMMDPLVAPFVYEILQSDAVGFSWLLITGSIGGMLGGLLIGRLSSRVRTADLFSVSSILVGLILFIMYRSASLPVVFLLTFLSSVLSIGSRVAMPTMLQEQVADAYRGRVFGTLDMASSLLMLVGVGGAGLMGERIGIVPVLSFGAGIMIVAGLLSFLLPRTMRRSDGGKVVA